MRGKQRIGPCSCGSPGLIPACAGKTFIIGGGSAAPAAHPRVCGENQTHRTPETLAQGSSPRVRGKRGFHAAAVFSRGLIPACAGKTRSYSPSGTLPGAHPRVCGENSTALDADSTAQGSSPRVRGKLVSPFAARCVRWLIPACAGKTKCTPIIHRPLAAHPRVCGENDLYTFEKHLKCGSSPRVRGKLLSDYLASLRRGLIPACAGKTAINTNHCHASWAHPRVCGENARVAEYEAREEGSSPRVRGKPDGKNGIAAPLRLIPACAGKTSASTMPKPQSSAHPRVCGENLPGSTPANFKVGSSPRVRGKHVPGEWNRPVTGLIPACAGKTLSESGVCTR